MQTDIIRKLLANRLWRAGLKYLSKADRKTLFLLLRRSHVSKDIHAEFESNLTLGQRVADKVAKFGGSWTFIISFGVVLVIWVVMNTLVLSTAAFDPYPFIFLNLILSMLAAIQAPVIMMSQNRQSTKDRLAAQHDYEVNLKAELEVMALHDKLDAMRIDMVEQLLKSQTEQLALLQELVANKSVKALT